MAKRLSRRRLLETLAGLPFMSGLSRALPRLRPSRKRASVSATLHGRQKRADRQRQLSRRRVQRPLDDQWRNEPPFLQTLGEKTQAGAVLGQNLHVVGARGARAGARIFGFIATDVGRLSSRAPHRCPANQRSDLRDSQKAGRARAPRRHD